jgi:ketosteroid isomerase-like protein
MVNWTRFDPDEYEIEFAEEKLEAHDVTVEEAAECLERKFGVRRNKAFRDRYRIFGRTEAGRALELVVYVDGRRIRVITGWDL